MGSVIIIGGGLAGCEAAWQASRLGTDVVLYEMRPFKDYSGTPYWPAWQNSSAAIPYGQLLFPMPLDSLKKR